VRSKTKYNYKFILIPVHIDDDLKERACRTAREQGMTMSAWIRAAMTRALDQSKAA
jgi:antitoxin component of RelBE/YafQ-DinJ toxin-antitoxin module